MTLFINIQKQQMFAKWVKESDWQTELEKWEPYGWIPILTNISISWQMLFKGWRLIKRKERLKLEKELFG